MGSEMCIRDSNLYEHLYLTCIQAVRTLRLPETCGNLIQLYNVYEPYKLYLLCKDLYKFAIKENIHTKRNTNLISRNIANLKLRNMRASQSK